MDDYRAGWRHLSAQESMAWYGGGLVRLGWRIVVEKGRHSARECTGLWKIGMALPRVEELCPRAIIDVEIGIYTDKLTYRI